MKSFSEMIENIEGASHRELMEIDEALGVSLDDETFLETAERIEEKLPQIAELYRRMEDQWYRVAE